MRKIVGQYTTTRGELKAIYDVSKSVMRHKDIEIGCEYELAYKLGRFDAYLKATLVLVTDDNRTLFFKNPERENNLIGIPIMNVLKYYKK
jgi:membrane-bound lytic murein transglycosylase MltF